MLKEGVNGFCMALADSVPGVSGGTVAFIMGFYDRFIGAIHDMAFGGMKGKKESARYLVKLGAGWIVGMVLAVLALSALFENHIYTVSSLFVGFIAGAIPLILKEEKDSFREVKKGILFGILGIVIVAGITWLNGRVGSASMNLGNFSVGLGIKLFFIGMVAISAMFLPGISGSTRLLIFGAYIPVITAVRGFFLFPVSCVLRMRCVSRRGNRRKGDQGLPGKIPAADGISDPWHDDRFFLRDQDGTNHVRNRTAGAWICEF